MRQAWPNLRKTVSNPITLLDQTLCRSWREFAAVVCLFFLGVLLPAAVPPDPAVSAEMRTRSPAFFVTHNLGALAFLWSGVLSLGITTFGAILLNGLSVGRVLFASDVPLMLRLALVVPHALFEFPAIWAAGTAGFRVPFRAVAYLRGTVDRPVDEEAVEDTFVLVLVSTGLITLAAVVEAYVTPAIVNLIV